ncbi:MAG TPA: ATP-binding cassette domain-containing protein [Dongiaceae bacterium]|nr:ATP-binding cassette domain-containing protein [Dongiaceae bacterium]
MATGLGMMRLEAVGRRFSDDARWVLADINLSLQKGEFVCLAGPSGSGKTTLMRIIAGLDKPDQGQRLLPARPPRIAMVFQEPRLVPWLTALDNLLLIIGRTEISRARGLLHMVELDECESSYPGQLSGGMQRRLALARALSIEPDLLLLDEPLVSLDPALEERMGSVLQRYWLDHQPAVIMVTHDPRQSARLASRVIGLAPSRTGLAFDEQLSGPPPGRRTDRDEASVIGRLITVYPRLPIAS